MPTSYKYIYLVKIKQVHMDIRTELDFAFKSSAGVVGYLEDLWENWKGGLSVEDWERVAPPPSIRELRAGLAAGISPLTGFETYEALALGFLTGEETFSVVVTVTRMPVY